MTAIEQKNTEQKYLRMSVNERFQHFLLLSSFITLIITGFWLKFPEAAWVKWMANIFGKDAISARAFIHRTASVIMIAASLYHVFYISFTLRGRKFVKDMWIRKQDALDAFHSILFLVGSSKTKPRFHRFSYIEKMEYWAVVWGTVIMGLTGGVLWFENTFMSIIRPEGMYIATTIHYYEAILASLAILVWHFYFVFMNPDIKGMNKAWITGHLTREEMMHEHPLELEELDKAAAGIKGDKAPVKEKIIAAKEKITETEKEEISETEGKDMPAVDTINNAERN